MKRRLIVTVGASLLLMGVMISHAPTSHAANVVHYVRGYSVQGSWLCYGWPGYYHCTQQWRWEHGHPVSLRPDFVPNRPLQSDPVARALGGNPVQSGVAGQPCRARVSFPARISQWTVPSGCYAEIYRPNPANYVSRPSYGWCNWWPEVLHSAFSGYDALHQPGHATPRVGAVVYFAPYVQGASSAGHYAQVVAIAPGGYWLLVTEMNFYWRGGGWAKVDYRYIHVGSGVSFRY